MDLIISNPFVFSLVIGFLIFIFAYFWMDRILNFFSEKTLTSQSAILIFMDKLFISQKQESIVRNCWILSTSLALLGILLFWPNIILSLGAASLFFLGTWIGIKVVLAFLWESHADKVVSQMVEALTIMCNSLKVGLSLPQAMDRVVKGYPGPLAMEFRLVLNKIQLGQSIEESLTEMGERLNRSDIDMLVSTINILKESGGNLAETFFVMSETIRSRQKMEKKIKALTAQGMMQAKIISCLPFFLIGILYFMDKPYVLPLLTKPLGWACLFIVVLLVVVGWAMMKKMVQIKV
ncbi:MAG: type II secretion system F family protein [Bdellovibrionales bacterium]